MAEALYRKYRPQVFEDVVGQEPIERTLKNAIRQDKVSHAYLFCGPRGTGKTTTARLLAKALLCQTGPTPDPDGTCDDCQLIAEGTHPDVYELDAASRTGVENVREEIISRVHFAPTRGRYKVYIIDEVHMLSTAAFNALLKTLEEPPSHVVFVLCTTDPQKVPETIHSRCQRFDYRRISPESMVSRLGAICVAEGVEFEGEALDLIAQRAEGGLRNALTSLEQIIAFENGKVTLAGAERLLGSIDSNDMAEIMAYIGKRDVANCFRWTAEYIETGADLAQFVRDMGEHVRNLYIMALVGDDAQLDITETARRELSGELAWFGPDRTARLLGVIGDLMAELKTTSNPRLAFEIALTRMVRPDSDLTLESLAERVEALESGYSAVAHVLPGDPYSVRTATESNVQTSAPALEYRDAVNKESGEERGPFSNASGAEAVQATPSEDAGTGAQLRAQEPAVAGATSAQPAGRPVLSEQNAIPAAGAAFDETSLAADSARAHDAVGAGNDGMSREVAAESSGDARPAEAAASGSKASSLANPAALQRIWQAVLVDVKKHKQAYGVLFMNTKAAFDEAKGMVRVMFPAESSFAFNAVQKPDVQSVLEGALAKAVGEPVAFYYEKGSDSAGPMAQSAAAASDARNAAFQQPLSQKGQQGAERAVLSVGQVVPAGRGAQASSQGSQPEVEQGAPVAHQAIQQQETAANPASGQVGQASFGRAPSNFEAAPYDEVPYEEAPYDEVPYDDYAYNEVPYGDFGGTYQEPSPAGQTGSASAAFAAQEAQSSAVAQRPSEGDGKQASIDAASLPADAGTSPSPVDAAFSPDGVAREDMSSLEAMLQASFGEGVVLRETDDD